MNIPGTKQDFSDLVELWEASVRKTHTFLDDKEIENIRLYVPKALKEISQLVIAVDEEDRPVAFMGAEDRKLEMLFVHPDHMGEGIGKALLEHGIKEFRIRELTVNEQNPDAIGFYEHMGFTTADRSEVDEQGNPYPILYMKRRKKK